MKDSRKAYGHDSILLNKSSDKKTLKPKHIIRFYFDNALSKPRNFILFLLLTSAILGMIMAIIQYFLLKEENFPGINGWWNGFSRILDPFGLIFRKAEKWSERGVNAMYWTFGTVISGTVVAFITQNLISLVQRLKAGRSQVISSDHTLILGWSNNIHVIVSEIAKANSNIKNHSIVVFCDQKNEFMQDYFKTNIPSDVRANIITRNGNITSPKDLQLVNPRQAKSIIVIGNSNSNDVELTMCIMALYTHVSKTDVTLIVQVRNKSTIEYLKNLNTINIIAVQSNDVIVKVCSQAIRQKGIGKVVLDFLDFDGNEIYYHEEPKLTGSTYLEAISSFENSAVMGIFKKDGNPLLNPSASTKIEAGDKIILLSEDDDTIFYTGSKPLTQTSASSDTVSVKTDGINLLVLGWSQFTIDVLNNYMGFSKSPQTIFLYVNSDLYPEIPQDLLTQAGNKIVILKEKEAKLPELIEANRITDVLVLPYSDKLSKEESDAVTLIKMIELNNINLTKENNKIRVIAYLLDSSKVELASITETEELIVSDNLSALMIAQYSENPHLKPVFEDIFDSDGAAINVVPASSIVGIGQQVTFSDIVRVAAMKGISVIGVSYGAGNGANEVRINIPKSESMALAEDDSLIVIS